MCEYVEYTHVNVDAVLKTGPCSESDLDVCVEVHPCSAVNATALWEMPTERLQRWHGNNAGGIKMQTRTFSLAQNRHVRLKRCRKALPHPARVPCFHATGILHRTQRAPAVAALKLCATRSLPLITSFPFFSRSPSFLAAALC